MLFTRQRVVPRSITTYLGATPVVDVAVSGVKFAVARAIDCVVADPVDAPYQLTVAVLHPVGAEPKVAQVVIACLEFMRT